MAENQKKPEFDKKETRQGVVLDWNPRTLSIVAIAILIVVVIYLSL